MRLGFSVLFAFLTIFASSQVVAEKDSRGVWIIHNRGRQSSSPSPLLKGATSLVKHKGRLYSKAELHLYLKQECRSRHLDPQWVTALVQWESGYKTHVVSDKGAMGLMQLMPDTAQRFGVKDPWDPHANIRGGLDYLVVLDSQFQGNLPLILAAYNAGENAVAKRGNRIPPYPETVRYVFGILRLAKMEGRWKSTANTLLSDPNSIRFSKNQGSSVESKVTAYWTWRDSRGILHVSTQKPKKESAAKILFKANY